jgi:phage terminase large subunit-like protein
MADEKALSGRKSKATSLEVEEFHVNDDVDVRPESHHHTTGPGPAQAAPGDHNHAVSPRAEERPSIQDLFGVAVQELDKAIVKPSIYRYEPYSDQLEFHLSECPGKFASGGNRAGKTTSVVIEAIMWATNTHRWRARPVGWGQGPLQLRFIAVDIEKGINQILLPAFKRWTPRSELIDGSWEKSWNSKALVLTFKNGSTIDFLTYNMDLERHGGVPRHIVFFDEEPPREIFNEALMRLLDYDGWWVISATPVKGMGWTYDMLWEPAEEGQLDGLVSIHQLDPANNPYLQAEDKSRFYIAMDDEEREMRSTGKFVARSGLVFPTFQKSTHVVDPFIPPANWRFFSSVDHGFNNPTAWLWHAVAPDGRIITFAEHYEREMTVNQHALAVIEREAGFRRTPTLRVGDPAMSQRSAITGTSILQEYASHGLYISTENIPHEVMIGIEKMQQYFAPQIGPDGDERPMWQITSNCPRFIRELRKLRWATYESTKHAYSLNRQEKVHKKDDHAFDSARYFATIMPDLRPEELLKNRGLAPGQTGSIWDVYATQQLAVRNSVPLADSGPSRVSWETTEYYDD